MSLVTYGHRLLFGMATSVEKKYKANCHLLGLAKIIA